MADYNEYMPLNALVVEPDATSVAPYRKPLEKAKPKAELRAIPPNERPLSWQVQTAADNYTAMHNKAKEAWDEYVISPDDVADARDYYENELMYEDFPGAIPLAALGSTLSGEAYNAWRDLQTDPANLLGGEIVRGGDKITDALGAWKRYKSNPVDLTKTRDVLIDAKILDDAPLYHGSVAKFDDGFKSGADADMVARAKETGYGGQYLGGGVYTDDDQVINLLNNLNTVMGKSGAETGYQYIVKPTTTKPFINTQAPAMDFIKAIPQGHEIWLDAGAPVLFKDPDIIDLSSMSGLNPTVMTALAEKYGNKTVQPLSTEELMIAYRNRIAQLLGGDVSRANRFIQQNMQARGIGGAINPSVGRKSSEWVIYNPNDAQILERQEVTQPEINELLEEMRNKWKSGN